MRFLASLCCVLLFWPLSVVAQDEDDRGFLTRTIEDALSSAGREVRIDGFQGALSSEASFDRMVIEDAEGPWLVLEDVKLVWSRLALLRGRLEVDQLSAALLELPRLPQTEETDELPAAEASGFSFELPDLPVSIDIQIFEVSEIVLGEPILGVPARLSVNASAQLNDAGLQAEIKAERTDNVTGAFNITANVERSGSEITLDLALVEEPGGIAAKLLNLPGEPSVDLKVAGSGPLDDFVTEIDLATDGQPRVEGQVTLTAEADVPEGETPDRRIQAQVGGDITALIAPEYQDFFGPDVALTVDTVLQSDGSIDVNAFEISARSLDLKGGVRLNAEQWPTFIDVEGELSQNGTPVVLPGSDAGVTVQSVVLDVSYDAEANDALKGSFDITELIHEAVEVAQTRLTLDGILDGDISSIGKLLADLELEATGISLADETASRALGDSITGGANINYTEDQPIRISGLNITGADYGAEGQVIVQGLENGFPTQLELSVRAQDLTRFAELSGQPLAGSARLGVRGLVTPLAGTFDLAITGNTQDLTIDIPQADAVLAGLTNLSLEAQRDETGTFVRDLILKNDALDVAANAELRTQASRVTAQVALADIALVVPQYQGPVSLEATASETVEGWVVQARADAPYDTKLGVDGLVTGPDADMRFTLNVPEVRPYVNTVNGPLSAQGRVQQSPKGYVVEISADGPYDAKVALEGLATGPDAQITYAASMPNIGVFVPKIGGPLSLQGEVARQGARWAINTDVEGPVGTTARVDGTAAEDGSDVDVKIVGQAPLGLSEPFLAPRSLQGQVQFDLAVNGAPGLNAVSGRITTNDASFTAPNLRLGLNGINAAVNLSGGAAQLDVGAAIAAGGRLTVGGNVNLTSLAANLAIALRNAVLTDPSLYAATLNGDITVNGPLTGGARIAGDINLAEVNVSVPATGLTSIGAIPDIRHVGSGPGVASTRARAGVTNTGGTTTAQSSAGAAYPLAININAPGRIFVRGRGLNAELGGGLRVTGNTNNIISAGSFDLIRGRLDVIGKRFELDEGSIQFQGSVTPFIRFVTTTQIPDGTASITVQGLATEPEITFSAVPDAPQDEVLSLIIFGRYVSQLSAFQALELINGLAELSGRKGVGVLGGVRQGIGLDELDVTTTETGETEVTAGKYLTDEIYTDVTTSASSGTDVSLNIDLTDDLTAKATVGSEGESSIGLFFERDY